MSVGKGWIDLNGTSVALKSPIDVLHLLQSVTHIAVGISKVGMDPEQTKTTQCVNEERTFPQLTATSMPIIASNC